MTSNPNPAVTRVVVADDHSLVRAGITALLRSQHGVEVIGEASDGAELIEIAAALRPDLVITDLEMPGLDGLSAIARIHNEYPQIRLLVLSMNDSVAYLRRAMSSGACGYLMKQGASTELALAVSSVMSFGTYITASLSQKLLQRDAPGVHDLLTARQVEILSLIARGRSAKEIGAALGLSPKTVDVHRAHISDRLGLQGTANLTMYAIREGLVSV